jgi:hypothetical protein
MKVLQNETLPDFQRGQTLGTRLAGASLNKTAILLCLSRTAVSKHGSIH